MVIFSSVLALLLQVVLTANAVPVPPPDVRPSGRSVVASAPSTDGTQPEAATGFGSVPPAWLGTRVLPEDPATGYGEVRPTPPVMRHRRWTLPDDVRTPLPGRGYTSEIVSPAPRRVV
ncbi:MAG TPA: M15 family peptidase, partial [Nocardioides sp.]|nr:M15 family peptidase [Nocardioides sp.]